MSEFDPVAALQQLIRFDTTTPPGNEAGAVRFVRELLAAGGIESQVYEARPGRPNLVARVAGQGRSAPLLMQAHADVVPADARGWSHGPFSGDVADGFVWGRGALDMKGGLVMMLGALLRSVANGQPPSGDVVLAVVADEEGGGDDGARFLVEQHPELFAGIRYAVGEFGGFTLRLAGATWSMIQVAEKQICRVRLTLRGRGGHGSLALAGGVGGRLGTVLRRLESPRLPVHLVPVVERMLDEMAASLPRPTRGLVSLLKHARTADPLLRALGPQGRILTPLLRNTATPTVIRAGTAVNVQPTSAEVLLDGRVLPGFGAAELVAELRALLGPDVELEVERFDPVPADSDLSFFPTLASVVTEHQPGVRPLPILLPASTDGRHFARLGIQTYGFTPMVLPGSMNFTTLVHGVDERIPVDALPAGVACLYDLLHRF